MYKIINSHKYDNGVEYATCGAVENIHDIYNKTNETNSITFTSSKSNIIIKIPDGAMCSDCKFYNSYTTYLDGGFKRYSEECRLFDLKRVGFGRPLGVKFAECVNLEDE